MIFPNKFLRFEESIIFKMHCVLAQCKQGGEQNIVDLYNNVEKHFECIDEYLYSIDILFVLDSVFIDFDKNTIKYVEKY